MLSTVAVLALSVPASPQPEPAADTSRIAYEERLDELDLDSDTVDDSPVLQRWLEETPDLETDIRHDSTIRSRIRAGYGQSLSDEDASNVWLGVEDLFIADSALAFSGEYRVALDDSDQESYNAELRYYLRPLGARVNIAPVAGYRSIETEDDEVDGPTVGMRLALALSRNGASDLSVSQVWVNPGSGDELGITTVSTGYAIAPELRIATEFQIQNSAQITQHQVGVGLEWLF